eukprot:7613957-Alexandrium_andersonii.AAC.1
MGQEMRRGSGRRRIASTQRATRRPAARAASLARSCTKRTATSSRGPRSMRERPASAKEKAKDRLAEPAPSAAASAGRARARAACPDLRRSRATAPTTALNARCTDPQGSP